jgi:hypothetical protein
MEKKIARFAVFLNDLYFIYRNLRVDSSICNIGCFNKNSLNYKKNYIGRFTRKKTTYIKYTKGMDGLRLTIISNMKLFDFIRQLFGSL